MAEKPIYVTRPSLPPLDEFVTHLQTIWDRKILTNGGPFHKELEVELCEFLGVEHLALFNNGTSSLIFALKTLDLKGEVITTPYTFVATSHSLMWQNLQPVFVDIDPDSWNIDPARIEEAITPKTSAILGVHCYGRPCDVGGIQEIADRHGLKVIYDAAHAFHVRDSGGSILRHGDLSTLSFHATKVFNTFEGGAVVCPDAETRAELDLLGNFGIVDQETVNVVGLNGKMNEMSAACGLLQLKTIETALDKRKRVDELYRVYFSEVPGIRCMSSSDELQRNYAYFPIVVEDEYPMDRDGLFGKLVDSGIHGRKYFYPLLSHMPMYKSLPSSVSANLPVAEQLAARVICLPIFPDLTDGEVERIAEVIVGAE